MAHAQTSPIGRFIRRLSVAHLVAAAPDGELVERFAVHREEAAFTALVRRHGPLVLGVCRRVLIDPHAAEDCFQETFLVLARKAGSLKRPGALGPWLYGVATRTALKARARAARRLRCERRACVAEAVARPDGLVWRDLRPKLDEAIAGLPEKYRAPFVLHYLEGLSVAEVAHRLGCPQGTAAARLARAKEQLRARLARQGLAWCAGALATALAQGAVSATVPAPLAAGTVQAAMLIAAGEAAGALLAPAAALITGGIQGMSVSKVKVALGFLLTVSALGVGVGVSQHARPVGGHAGADGLTTPGAREANGRQRPGGDALGFWRYYAGGFRSLRGFELWGVGPEVDGFRVGGDLQFLNSLEYQVPVKANEQVFLVAFIDSGTVERTASPPDDPVPAGTGIRRPVPMLGPVPISLDFGFPVVKPPERLFGFWIGFFS
jgi:RNA polymerase sigma factor (sigma-70 family)